MLTGEKPKKEAKKAEVTAPAPEKQIVIAAFKLPHGRRGWSVWHPCDERCENGG